MNARRLLWSTEIRIDMGSNRVNAEQSFTSRHREAAAIVFVLHIQR
jgi:hypothetical protein